MVTLKDMVPRQAASRALGLKIASASCCRCLICLQATPGDHLGEIKDAAGLLWLLLAQVCLPLAWAGMAQWVCQEPRASTLAVSGKSLPTELSSISLLKK